MAHCRTRVADILPSLCDGGVVVALGVLAAATSADAVTAATRLLVALTLSQTSNLAGMKRLNMCVRTVGGAVCVCVCVRACCDAHTCLAATTCWRMCYARKRCQDWWTSPRCWYGHLVCLGFTTAAPHFASTCSPLCVCALFSQLLFAMAGMRDVAVMVENESHSPVHSSQRRHLADIVSDATRAASRLETG